MIVCEHCGNKRCPHATDHDFECTNSNEPGQPGSIYAQTPNPTTKNMSEENKPDVGKVIFGPWGESHPGGHPNPSNLERAVEVNTLAIERMQDEIRGICLEIERMRGRRESSATMPNPLPGHPMIDEQVWLTAWAAGISSIGVSQQGATNIADACLQDFKARFRKPA